MYQYYAKLASEKKETPKVAIIRKPTFFEKPPIEHEKMEEENPIVAQKEEVKQWKYSPKPKGIHGANGKFISKNGESTVKKQKKTTKLWDETCTMISVNPPVPIDHPILKKKYFITFVYKQNDGIHKKTVKFGKKGVQDYIDHKNRERRDLDLARMKSYYNPFKGNYWRFYLLNQCTTVQEAYTKYLNEKNLL